jgi:hypothetical protein
MASPALAQFGPGCLYFQAGALAPGVIGVAYSKTITALETCSFPTITYSVAQEFGGLPAGLALSSGGTISGTPTAAGTFYFTIDAVDSGGNVASGVFGLTITATAPPTIATSSPLPAATLGSAYSQTLTATGGSPPYTWSVTSGALPAGLTLASVGMISGTPTAAGSFSFAVQVKDSAAATASATLSLTVNPMIATQLTIATSTLLLSGFTGGAYSQDLAATGGSGAYTWTITSGTLPAGLTLSGANITGTPTAAGTFTFTLQVTDSAGNTATQAFSLTVVNVSASALSRVGVLSQFAAGASVATTIWVVNTSAAVVPVRLVFHDDDGTLVLKDSNGNVTPTPLTATQQGDTQVAAVTTLDRVLNPNTTLVIAAGQGQAVNVQGWVDVLATATVSGFAIFTYAPDGLTPTGTGYFTPWEGTVPLQSQLSASTLTLPFINSGGFITGVAIGSITGSAGNITATFYDLNGNALAGSSPQIISLPANGHTAFLFNTGPTGQNWSFTSGQQGIVKFTGSSLIGLGLRVSPYSTETALPTILQ